MFDVPGQQREGALPPGIVPDTAYRDLLPLAIGASSGALSVLSTRTVIGGLVVSQNYLHRELDRPRVRRRFGQTV